MTLPYNITNGQAIDATPVMANFNSLDGRLPASNVVAAAAGANSDITSLSGLTTPLSTAQGGTGINLATTPLPVAEGGTGDSGTAWSAQTVTPTAGSGTLTTASATWRFKVIGKTAFYELSITITTNGSGATSIIVPLPTGWSPKAGSTCSGVGTAISGAQVSGYAPAAGSTMIVRKYDATYPAVSGENFVLSGVLELT